MKRMDEAVRTMYWEDVCVMLDAGVDISDEDLDACAQYNAQSASDGAIMMGESERSGETAAEKMYGEILASFGAERGRCLENHHDYQLSRSCGANVCVICDDHKGLARCYCGWSRSGEDGRRELEEMGEVIDEY